MNRNAIAMSMMRQAPQIPGAQQMPQMLNQPTTPPVGGLMGGGLPPTPAASSPFMQGAQQGAMQMGGAAPGRIPPQQQVLPGATPPAFPGVSATGMPDLSAGQQVAAGFGSGGGMGMPRQQTPQMPMPPGYPSPDDLLA